MRATRRFNWISSVHGDPLLLNELDVRLRAFYGASDGTRRETYQRMLDSQGDDSDLSSPTLQALLGYMCTRSPSSVVEVGCGDGRTFRQLRRRGLEAPYTGIEVSSRLTEGNRRRHPEANWLTATAYQLPLDDASVDCCFAYYVLEHLVYPERGLLEMLRVVAPGGELILVFPDFQRYGILPSQMLGFSVGGTATEKLRARRFLDASVSLYDSRVRLRRALCRVPESTGPFPVNLSPVCFLEPEVLMPDMDAVYIATRGEIERWAEVRGISVRYPCGEDGELWANALMVLRRPQVEATGASVASGPHLDESSH